MSTPDDLAALFRRAAEHAARYRETIAGAPQRPQQTYADAARAWDVPTPEQGTPAGEVLDELVTRAGPGLHAATGPRFHGWVIGNSHPAGVAADWLTSAWGQNAGNHTASPAAAAAEDVARQLHAVLGEAPPDLLLAFVSGPGPARTAATVETPNSAAATAQPRSLCGCSDNTIDERFLMVRPNHSMTSPYTFGE